MSASPTCLCIITLKPFCIKKLNTLSISSKSKGSDSPIACADTKKASILLIRKIYVLMQNLGPLPNDVCLTMKLFYYDEGSVFLIHLSAVLRHLKTNIFTYNLCGGWDLLNFPVFNYFLGQVLKSKGHRFDLCTDCTILQLTSLEQGFQWGEKKKKSLLAAGAEVNLTRAYFVAVQRFVCSSLQLHHLITSLLVLRRVNVRG